jgi:hypothetical protein
MNYSLAFGIVVGVLIFFLAVLIFLAFFFPFLPNPLSQFWKPWLSSERVIDQQVKELDTLREKSGDADLTEEEIESQVKELDSLHDASGDAVLSEEDIQRQIEELDMLHQQAQNK